MIYEWVAENKKVKWMEVKEVNYLLDNQEDSFAIKIENKRRRRFEVKMMSSWPQTKVSTEHLGGDV